MDDGGNFDSLPLAVGCSLLLGRELGLREQELVGDNMASDHIRVHQLLGQVLRIKTTPVSAGKFKNAFIFFLRIFTSKAESAGMKNV